MLVSGLTVGARARTGPGSGHPIRGEGGEGHETWAQRGMSSDSNGARTDTKKKSPARSRQWGPRQGREGAGPGGAGRGGRPRARAAEGAGGRMHADNPGCTAAHEASGVPRDLLPP